MTAEEIFKCLQVGLKCVESLEGVVREALRDGRDAPAPADPGAPAPNEERPAHEHLGLSRFVQQPPPRSVIDDVLEEAIRQAAGCLEKPEIHASDRAVPRPPRQRPRPVVCALCEMPRGPHRLLIALGRGAVCEHCLANCAEARLKHAAQDELSLERTMLLAMVCSTAAVQLRLSGADDPEVRRAHQRLTNLVLGGPDPAANRDDDERARILTLDA